MHTETHTHIHTHKHTNTHNTQAQPRTHQEQLNRRYSSFPDAHVHAVHVELKQYFPTAHPVQEASQSPHWATIAAHVTATAAHSRSADRRRGGATTCRGRALGHARAQTTGRTRTKNANPHTMHAPQSSVSVDPYRAPPHALYTHRNKNRRAIAHTHRGHPPPRQPAHAPADQTYEHDVVNK